MALADVACGLRNLAHLKSTKHGIDNLGPKAAPDPKVVRLPFRAGAA